MDANPFRSARAYLASSSGAKWGALACSALSPVCLALLFPLLFLFADLLGTRGRVPEYTELPAARQAAFRDEWDAGGGVKQLRIRQRGWIRGSKGFALSRWRAHAPH